MRQRIRYMFARTAISWGKLAFGTRSQKEGNLLCADEGARIHAAIHGSQRLGLSQLRGPVRASLREQVAVRGLLGAEALVFGSRPCHSGQTTRSFRVEFTAVQVRPGCQWQEPPNLVGTAVWVNYIIKLSYRLALTMQGFRANCWLNLITPNLWKKDNWSCKVGCTHEGFPKAFGHGTVWLYC